VPLPGSITGVAVENQEVARRFEHHLDDLQARLLEMGALVETAIHDSIRALLDRDEAPARRVIENERRIDRMELTIDDCAVGLFALNQPTACDMRRLAATVKINNDLERMGDLAAHIAERTLSVISQAPLPLLEIPQLARLSAAMVHDSLDALVRHDAELAQRVVLADDEVDRLRDTLYSSLIASMRENAPAISWAIHLLFIVRHLERIADHATNIGEDVLYYLRGVDVRHHASVA